MIKDNRQLLVMIHGWGFDTGVFKNLADRLETDYRLQLIDLPGYAGKSDVSEYSLQNITAIVAEQIEDQVIIIGWSMAGLIGIDLACRYPEKVKKLILLTSTPCFGKKRDWSAAMDRNILKKFVMEYNKQPAETLDKFSYLAAEGTKNPRSWIRELKRLSIKKVSQQALEQGLQILLMSDLRNNLKEVKVPILMIFGEKDSLVPVSAEKEVKLLNEKIATRIIPGSGHTPFLTDTKMVSKFINEHVAG